MHISTKPYAINALIIYGAKLLKTKIHPNSDKFCSTRNPNIFTHRTTKSKRLFSKELREQIETIVDELPTKRKTDKSVFRYPGFN